MCRSVVYYLVINKHVKMYEFKLHTVFSICKVPFQKISTLLLSQKRLELPLIAGYWPSFFCEFVERDGAEVHKFAKNELGQYLAILTEKTWSIKDRLCNTAYFEQIVHHQRGQLWYAYLMGIFSHWTLWAVPSRQDTCSLNLPTRAANHSARFISSCPLTELL